nr:late expression factor 1 [Ectropis obliqua nucleopolyhedrovirus]
MALNQSAIFAGTYSMKRAKLMWNNVAFNDCRTYAFLDVTQKWHHPTLYFENFEKFYNYLRQHRISDVHVKPLPDNGGREWVVDVDIEATDCELMLKTKISVAKVAFVKFFGTNVTRIMYSGNRGIHVWLRIDKFRMNADKSVRQRYFDVFVMPKKIVLNEILPNSFVWCVQSAFEEDEIRLMLKQLYKGQVVDASTLIKDFWPAVDKHIFCNLNQIRAPFSYNSKGKKFSLKLH